MSSRAPEPGVEGGVGFRLAKNLIGKGLKRTALLSRPDYASP